MSGCVDLAAVIGLFRTGKTSAEIGRIYDVSRQYINKMLNDAGVDPESGGLALLRRVREAQQKAGCDARAALAAPNERRVGHRLNHRRERWQNKW